MGSKIIAGMGRPSGTFGRCCESQGILTCTFISEDGVRRELSYSPLEGYVVWFWNSVFSFTVDLRRPWRREKLDTTYSFGGS